jgi:segregation and condensation protein A
MEYNVKLSAFQGPIDLLLELVSKAKIEIKDIFVSDITEQYLHFIKQHTPDMDTLSDFLKMAATLLYIKSRALLPLRKDEDLDEDGLTPEERLIAKLNEYKLYKAVCDKLKPMERKAGYVYYKRPEELFKKEQEDTTYLNADIQTLKNTYLRILKEKEKQNVVIEPKSVIIIKDHFSVKKQMSMIIEKINMCTNMSFYELLSEKPSNEEVAVTLMSVLELMNKDKLKIRQSAPFADIKVLKK